MSGRRGRACTNGNEAHSLGWVRCLICGHPFLLSAQAQGQKIDLLEYLTQ